MPETIPIACTLEQAELTERAELIAELGQSLVAVEAEGAHATLRFPADRREALRAFIRAEFACCPFFDFELTDELDRARLEISAPEGGEWAVRGLVAGLVAGWGGLV